MLCVVSRITGCGANILLRVQVWCKKKISGVAWLAAGLSWRAAQTRRQRPGARTRETRLPEDPGLYSAGRPRLPPDHRCTFAISRLLRQRT